MFNENNFEWEEKVITENNILNNLIKETGNHKNTDKEILEIILKTLEQVTTEKMLFWMIENKAAAKKICGTELADSEEEFLKIANILKNADMRHLYYIWMIKNNRLEL